MAEALVSVLLEQLVSVAYEHTKEAVTMVLNAEEDVKKFSRHLTTIQAALEDAEQQQVMKASVRDWLDRLKDVSYEMDNVLDKWNTEILKQQVEKQIKEGENAMSTKKKVCFSVVSNLFCFGQVNKAIYYHKTASEIKDLNEDLASIVSETKEFGFLLSSVPTKEYLNERPKTSFFVDNSTIIGREEVATDLLSKLLDESDQEGKGLLVIPIVGMGGIGKTTLAQVAYNSETVVNHFEKRVWVCVSDPFDEVRIAKAIITGSGKASPNSDEMQDVLQCMSDSIKEKKFLIVLDDVWTEDPTKWANLKLPIIMQSCAKGSRLLVTTRSEGVAKMMRATTHMIHLEKLSHRKCLELFNSIAYLNRAEDEADGFGAIGEKIARKCDGLPLAAICLGSLMQYKMTREEWQEVLDSKIWDQTVVEQVFRPLLLSYYDLSPVVKRCLLFCAIFPKDHLFNNHNLIQLWMSQNYLSGNSYKEKEKRGREIFDTLVMRSFFQNVVEQRDEFKSITKLCKMHDFVHDFVHFLNGSECYTTEGKEANERISDKTRHLTLLFAPSGFLLLDLISPLNCKKLRTLTTFDSKLSSRDVIVISQLKGVRTLNLSKNDIRELPEEIGELIHLRYLDLSENRKLEKLPNGLGNLYNLQTLCLNSCEALNTLPATMGNLISLRHLQNMGCYWLEYLPKGIGRLTSLQTLDWCPVMHQGALSLEDVGGLDQLEGCMQIYMEDTSDAQKARLWNKKLYHLELWFYTADKQSHAQVLEALRPHQGLEILGITGYGGTSQPSWMLSLQNLRILYLTRSLCECLPPLGKLPFLEELKVITLDKVKTVGDEFLGITDTQASSSSSSASPVFFPKLKHLFFTTMREWEEWEGVGGWTETGGAEITIMPSLVSFEVQDCPKLKNLPLFLQKTPVSSCCITSCRRSIIVPVMPDNCQVKYCGEEIEDPVIPDVTDRVETEI